MPYRTPPSSPSSSSVLVLHPRIKPPFGATAGSIAFLAMALYMVRETQGVEHVFALLCTALFALLALGMLGYRAGLFPGAGTLVLTPEGFDARLLVFSRFVRWDAVGVFVAYEFPETIVGYNLVGITRRAWDDDDLDRSDRYIDSQRFGMSGNELAALLNEWREHRGPRPQ